MTVQKMKHIYLTVDGACSGNPGPGGWACSLRYGGHMRELFGSEEHTTNNRMELGAVIEGLKALHEPCEVTVITDSQYVTSGITQWPPQWKANGWRKKSKGASYTQAVLNRDLWGRARECFSETCGKMGTNQRSLWARGQHSL